MLLQNFILIAPLQREILVSQVLTNLQAIGVFTWMESKVEPPMGGKTFTEFGQLELTLIIQVVTQMTLTQDKLKASPSFRSLFE